VFADIDALMKEVDKFNRNVRESDELTQRLLQIENELKQSNQFFLTSQETINSIKTDEVPEIHSALQRMYKKVQLAIIVSAVTSVLALVILIMLLVK